MPDNQNSSDIVERLRALSRCEHSDLSVGDEAAAEIVRLRGEVAAMEACAVKYLGWLGVKDPAAALRKDMADPEMLGSAIAQAEAKGECSRCGMPTREAGSSMGLRPIEMCACATITTPQPAGGAAVSFDAEAVAWAYRKLLDFGCYTSEAGAMMGDRLNLMLLADTTSPAAQVQHDYLSAELAGMTAAYERMSEYQVTHNGHLLLCSAKMRDAYSDVVIERDELRAKLATHPAAGDKVRELVAKWRSDADDDMRMNLPLAASVASACADELEAALGQGKAS